MMYLLLFLILLSHTVRDLDTIQPTWITSLLFGARNRSSTGNSVTPTLYLAFSSSFPGASFWAMESKLIKVNIYHYD